MGTRKQLTYALCMATVALVMGCNGCSKTVKDPTADWTIEIREDIEAYYDFNEMKNVQYLLAGLTNEQRSRLMARCLEDLFNPNQHPRYRVISVYALDALADKRLRSKLIHLLVTEPQSGVRWAIAHALEHHDNKDIADDLLAAAENVLQNNHFTIDVANALRNKPYPEVKAWLIKTGIEVDDARWECIDVLRSFDDPSLLGSMQKIAAAERNPQERKFYEEKVNGFAKRIKTSQHRSR